MRALDPDHWTEPHFSELWLSAHAVGLRANYLTLASLVIPFCEMRVKIVLPWGIVEIT